MTYCQVTAAAACPGGADLTQASDIRQWVVSLYFAMTTVTTVGYGDITAHSTVEQVCILPGAGRQPAAASFKRTSAARLVMLDTHFQQTASGRLALCLAVQRL